MIKRFSWWNLDPFYCAREAKSRKRWM